jgi:phage shock protein E
MNRSLKIASVLAFAAIVVAPLLVTSAELSKDPLETVLQNVTEEKAVLVDVREKKEWDAGHVEGAIFLPLSALNRGMDAETLGKLLPADKFLYLHCVVGKRAVTAGNILEEYKYSVRPIKPGYEELIEAGFKKAEE